MAPESKQNKHKVNSELFQLLLCVVVIGVFLLVETWLIFYYDGGFVFPLIFGVLTILMLCLLALNMYQIFVKRFLISGGSSDKKAEFLIYKQVKSLPDTFDKVNDKFNAFVLTKLSSDGETAVDENMTAAKNGTSVNVANIPAFDTGAKVVVLALKKDADETDVKSEDILYFTQITATDIADNALTIPAYEAGMQIKLSGNINGVHTVVKTVAE